jgi:hypothetical protein
VDDSSAQAQHSYEPLMMETATLCETPDTTSTFNLLSARKNFIPSVIPDYTEEDG